MIVALRIVNRNVRGLIQLPAPLHLQAARSLLESWRRALGPGWGVALIDSDGGTVL